MELKTVLKDLCMANGVNGVFEAAQVAVSYLSAYTTDIRTDAMGNVYGYIPSKTPNAPTVLLEAHIDEIGFVVTHIDEQGFVHLSACGGIDNRTLTAAEVVILTEPPLNGVFCSTPPHLSKDDEELPEIASRGVDVGLSHNEAVEKIPLGTRAVFRPHFDELPKGKVCAKALDDRAGVAVILRTLELVKENTLPVNVIASFCVQEEVGCRGSAPAAFATAPDAALVVDVSFAYTPDADKNECGVLGDGVMIGFSPILDRKITERLVALATAQNIPMQREVMGSRTGTDADAITIAGSGVPTALLSVPQRYMHTPVEVVSLQDIEATAQLMAAFIMNGEVQVQ